MSPPSERSHSPTSFYFVFSTYPMGQDPIWPQIVSLMAVVSTISAFSVFDWDDEERNFMCFRASLGGGTEDFECFPLRLSDPSFWSDSDAKGWAAAVQTAAVFGILACTAGFVALCQLLLATCFVLSTRQVLVVVFLHLACAVLSIFTLVAGAADICKAVNDVCEKEGVHMDTGAGFMLFGFFAHLAALALTGRLFLKLRRESLPAEEAQSLTGAIKVTKTLLAGGGCREEKEFMDESGQQVKEVKISFPKPEEAGEEGGEIAFAKPPADANEIEFASSKNDV